MKNKIWTIHFFGRNVPFFIVPQKRIKGGGTFENTCKNMEHFMYPTTLYPNWCGIGVKYGGVHSTAEIDQKCVLFSLNF